RGWPGSRVRRPRGVVERWARALGESAAGVGGRSYCDTGHGAVGGVCSCTCQCPICQSAA
ncbi:hypothetical protein CDV36_016651, partial [Fusarium kuroshium]